MKVSDFLSAADVTIDAAVADKKKLLRELARRAAAAVELDAALVLVELEKREELGSTGMGGGVAIPHARFHQLRRPFATLVRLRKPIEFEAVDGEPVDTIVLLLLPDAREGERLSALACIARKLRDSAVVTALRKARDSAGIYRSLTAD